MKCMVCSKEISTKHKYCSQQCYWSSLKGKPTWNTQKRITVECVTCGNKIDTRENLPRKYCSKACTNIGKIGKHLPKRGGKIAVTCGFCKKEFYKWRYEKNRMFCSRKCRGGSLSLELRGEYNNNWKGGISKSRPLNRKDHRQWRNAIFTRDDYTCQECGIRGVYLEAHHIKSWAEYPKLRLELSNGQTLCKECHAKTDNYRGRKVFK